MKTNYPNPLLRGGPVHKHYDRDNTTTIALSSGGIFTGKWQLNTSPDVMVSCSASSEISVQLQYSNDNGLTFVEDAFTVLSGEEDLIIRKKGSRSFRIIVSNVSGNNLLSMACYTYYGDFNAQADPIVLGGSGSGDSGDPLIQDVSSTRIEDQLNDILIETRITNMLLREAFDLTYKQLDLED